MRHLLPVALGLTLILAVACKPSACEEITCVNGSCVDGTCQCEIGWIGEDCSVFDSCGTYCQNGTCDNGACNCLDGFEGQFCENAVRDKFVGTYNLSETCFSAGAAAYSVSVDTLTDSLHLVKFVGLYQSDTLITAAAVPLGNTRELLLFHQNFGTSMEIEGMAALDSAATTLTVDYKLFQPGNPTPTDSCMATMVRQ